MSQHISAAMESKRSTEEPEVDEAAEYVDSIMSTQQAVRVATPLNINRKRNRSAPSPTLESVVKKARNSNASPPERRAETRRALYTEPPTPAPRRKVQSQTCSSEQSMECLIKRLSFDINEKFTALNDRIDRLEKGLEQKISNKVAQLLDKRINVEMKRLRKDVDAHIENVTDGIKAEVAADIADIHKRLDAVSSNSHSDLSCNIVVRNLAESANENIEEKVSLLISEGCGVRDVNVIAAERKKGPRGKPGTVVAKLNSRNDAKSVLANKRKLKSSKRFSNVYIQPDVAKSDRVVADNFRAILAAVKNGSHNISMRGNRIITDGGNTSTSVRNEWQERQGSSRQQGYRDGDSRRYTDAARNNNTNSSRHNRGRVNRR